MRPIDNSRRAKHFQENLRPSQSLHCRFLKSNLRDLSKRSEQRNLDELTICIIYKKKKIEFHVQNKTSFEELNRQLYQHLHAYLLHEAQLTQEKIERAMKSIVGFESVDGDVNFDYRLSLQKGQVEKTKFFYPFSQRSSQNDPIKYKIYNCLAIGGFSKVYLARSYENGQFYAIKFIRKLNSLDPHEADKY
jgi:hypothetical protein